MIGNLDKIGVEALVGPIGNRGKHHFVVIAVQKGRMRANPVIIGPCVLAIAQKRVFGIKLEHGKIRFSVKFYIEGYIVADNLGAEAEHIEHRKDP
jgi:hypothetical protein